MTSVCYVCPFCREGLVGEHPAQRCPACARAFTSENGIVDFSEGRYFDAFVPGQPQTDAQREGVANEVPGAVSRVRDFYLPLLAARGARRILDSGCGNGLSVDLLCAEGLDAWGADLSALRALCRI